MSSVPRPSEFYKVTALIEGKYKRERTYKGPGGKKKAQDYATHAKRNGATRVILEASLPSWEVIYEWSGQESID